MLYGVGAVGCMLLGREAIQGDVAVYHCHCLGGAVHTVDVQGSPAQGVNRKTSGVAEEVQDVAAGGIALHQGAVFALVEEETGLLAFSPVYQELVAVLQHCALPRLEAFRLPDIPVHQLQAGLEGGGAATLVVDGLEGIPIHRLQRLADLRLGAEHAHRVRLQHADAVVVVYYQPGKAVALAMHQTVAVGAGAVGQAHGAPGLPGRAYGIFPERSGRGVCIEREDADGDGTHLPVPGGEVFALGGINSYHIPFCGVAHRLRNRTGEHPGMESADRLVTPLFEVYLCHFLTFSRRARGSCSGGSISSGLRGCFSLSISFKYISRQTQASVAA